MARPRADGGLPNNYLTHPNKTEYAPGFYGSGADHGFVNGNLVSGGIKVRSKDEVVALAEELLDWAWGPAPK